MSFTKITDSAMNTHGVRGLADTPNLSAYDLQCKFDELATDVLRPAHDNLVDELAKDTAAANIGIKVPTGMTASKNIQAVVNNLATSNHTHSNKPVLDKLSEVNGELGYNGEKIVSSFEELPEINITSPTGNDFLQYDAQSEKWKNVSGIKADQVITSNNVKSNTQLTADVSNLDSDKISKPSSPNTNDVLSYDGTNWIATGIADTSKCYKTTDDYSPNITDNDFIPFSNLEGKTRKTYWSILKARLGDIFALKNNTVLTGSLSMGRLNASTVGTNSAALGTNTKAEGSSSHAEGEYTTAEGSYSHAEGRFTTAEGSSSHAEGLQTVASGKCSHSEGEMTTASGINSHAEGLGTKASSTRQHVQGRYNEEDTTNTYAHIVGNGTSASDRKNIHTLDWSGNAWFEGDVESETYGKLSEKIDKPATASANQVLTFDGTDWIAQDSQGGGGGGTSNYSLLTNKPSINNVVLDGNKSASDLGINVPTSLSDLSADSTHRTVTDTEKTTWNSKANKSIVSDEWSSGTYESGSIVIYNNKLYKNTSVSATAGTPGSSSAWTETSVGNELTSVSTGTWTPVMRGASDIDTISNATWTKYGKQVWCYANIKFATITDTNVEYIQPTSLPYEPFDIGTVIGCYRHSDINGIIAGRSNSYIWLQDKRNAFSGKSSVDIVFSYLAK